MLDICVAGVVLSGGGSRLAGILDAAESVLRRAVRLAWPAPLPKMPAVLAEPEYATLLGMVYYSHRARIARGIQDERWSSRLKSLFALKGA
jgi:cell division protein FtsA